MAVSIARLEETASLILKVQVTATGPYRYRLEGIVHASLHAIIIEKSVKNVECLSKKL